MPIWPTLWENVIYTSTNKWPKNTNPKIVRKFLIPKISKLIRLIVIFSVLCPGKNMMLKCSFMANFKFNKWKKYFYKLYNKLYKTSPPIYLFVTNEWYSLEHFHFGRKRHHKTLFVTSLHLRTIHDYSTFDINIIFFPHLYIHFNSLNLVVKCWGCYVLSYY